MTFSSLYILYVALTMITELEISELCRTKYAINVSTG